MSTPPEQQPSDPSWTSLPSAPPPVSMPSSIPAAMALPPLAPGTPIGWYPDPADPGTQRYWDGHAWTGHAAALRQAPPVAPVPAPYPTVVPVTTPMMANPRQYAAPHDVLSIASLALGILAVLSSLATPILGILTAIPAIVLGHIGARTSARQGKRGHGLAIAGFILGYVSILICTIVLVVEVSIMGNS